ncbi:MAG TPA: hypothetical protein VFZ32_08685 [Micromonosporaceae bacterium]
MTAIGHARVSNPRDQNSALQRDALADAGCAKMFTHLNHTRSRSH